MKQFNSRRKFMQKIGLASGGFMMFSSTNVLRAFNSTNCPFPGYNPFADTAIDMRTSLNVEDHIMVSGTVYGRNNMEKLANTSLEVWHLSPGYKKYRHQAILRTDENGEYQFYTDMPDREYGKNPRIFFRISNNEKSYFTELIIGKHYAYVNDKHWLENHCLGDLMQPVKDESHIKLNLSI